MRTTEKYQIRIGPDAHAPAMVGTSGPDLTALEAEYSELKATYPETYIRMNMRSVAIYAHLIMIITSGNSLHGRTIQELITTLKEGKKCGDSGKPKIRV